MRRPGPTAAIVLLALLGLAVQGRAASYTFALGDLPAGKGVTIVVQALVANPLSASSLSSQSSAVGLNFTTTVSDDPSTVPALDATVLSADPSPRVSITSALSHPEGDSGSTLFVFLVSLDKTWNRTVTVNYATGDGSATVANSDYQAASGTLSFPAGVTQVALTVSATGDTAQENDESFTVQISLPVNAALSGSGLGVGTIVNDDFPSPTITPSATPTCTATETSTVTPSVTPSDTASVTPSITPSVTPSNTQTDTPSITASVTPSNTQTNTPSVTATDTETVTSTPTPTVTATASQTQTLTATATQTSSSTLTPTSTETPSFTASPTESMTSTISPTITDSPTPSPSFTASPTIGYQHSDLGRTVMAPVPAPKGQPVCLFFTQAPASSHWDIYAMDKQRIAVLDFKAEASQCWTGTSQAAVGFYLAKVHVVYADGHAEDHTHRIIITP